MANRLNMARIQAIKQLKTLKWSQRRIAKELGIDRGTVARHLRGFENYSKAAISPTGNSGPKASTFPPSPGTFSENASDADFSDESPESKAAISPAGSKCLAAADSKVEFAAEATSSGGENKTVSVGRPSLCEAYREIIEAKLAAQLSAQRIWQDLVAEHGFEGKYDSVKRFVRRLVHRRPLPMRRMEVAAGEEAQVDFGSGAKVVTPGGRRRKTHVFRIVLSHSRKAYSDRSTVAAVG